MIQFPIRVYGCKLDEYNEFLSKELEHVSEREIWSLFHDEMGEVYSPVYFHEFVAHACRHRLQYVAEANYHELQTTFALTEETREAFAAMADGWLDREQYLDFVKCRRFRQTLLCHADVALNRQPSAAVCRGLWASSSAHAVSEEPDFTPGVPEEFKGPHGSGMKTAHPVAKLALAQLIANWPASVSFEALNATTRAHADSDEDLERILFIMFSAGLIELHSYRAPAVPVPGARPRAWKMARYQADRHLECGRSKESFMTSLRHASVQASGRIELEVVRLLNGRRDRKQLVQALRPLFDDSISRKQLAVELESSLQQLARSGLLDR